MAKGKKNSGVELSVLKEKRADYVVTKVDKKRLIDNGDDVATRLRGLDLDEVYAMTAKHTGQTEKELRERYQHLNVGMQRMNLGNKLRGSNEPKAPKAKKEKAAKAPKTAKKAKTKKVTPKAPVSDAAAA